MGEPKRIRIGMQAMGVSTSRDSDYSLAAIESRRAHLWIVGTVVDRHDSHGECFDLKYEDGSIATYDPEEIRIV